MINSQSHFTTIPLDPNLSSLDPTSSKYSLQFQIPTGYFQSLELAVSIVNRSTMRRFIIPVLLAASYATAQGECPQRWWNLAGDLETFFHRDGTCSDPARAAIRLAFHDCFPGTCDGSIIKAGECTSRPENAQMVEVCTILGNKSMEYNVSAADIVQFGAGRLSLQLLNLYLPHTDMA